MADQQSSRSGFSILSEWMPGHWRLFLTVAAAASVVVWSGIRPSQSSFFIASNEAPFAALDATDQSLAQAASSALAGRQGTVIVVDPQTGRIRAVVNSQIAFGSSYAPGSTIKPFTALAALRAGLIDKNSRLLCREHYERKGFRTVCAHPRDLAPFDPATALAYSCNYYFGRLGERLSESRLSDTLSSFGFGKATPYKSTADNPGQLARGKPDPRNALGEGDYLQTTPLQLIMAYSALLNGGRLLRPEVATAANFQTHERARLLLAPEHRSIILDGMRGAVEYGTASHARLNSTRFRIFGKTGTSTPQKGFRSQGWFIGFAADSSDSETAPDRMKLGVLVFLKRGHGANAAEVSRSIFEEYARLVDQDFVIPSNQPAFLISEKNQFAVKGWALNLVPRLYGLSLGLGTGGGHPLSVPARETSIPPQNSPSDFKRTGESIGRMVKVHLVRDNVTREVPLEDYVATVVATEGGMEDQPEALKALAVAVRTYALKNAGRHASEGYDFCSTTHCQRYQSETDNASSAEVKARALSAVQTTEAKVLRDQTSSLVDAYFSASCGGMTANLKTLWGAPSPAYLRGVHDNYCSVMPHHEWVDTIPAEQMLEALRSDARTNPGVALNGLRVLRRDLTGRAELIEVDGQQSHVVRGWDFKIIVGRKLGWNFLKSSRFEVGRIGADFIFRGSGFGHGLGLCQEGAHVMAARGADYERILGKYFPGTFVSKEAPDHVALLENNDSPTSSWSRHQAGADLIWNGRLSQAGFNTVTSFQSKRTSLSSEHFRVNFSVRVGQNDAEQILRVLEMARATLLKQISAAGVAVNDLPNLDVFINESTGDFVGRTGQPWWAAAATNKNRIELQPVELLKRRKILETTLKHEVAHAVLDLVGKGRAPRWLAEGMAIYFAGEGQLMERYRSTTRISVPEIEAQLAKSGTAEDMRKAYAAAYLEVRNLVKTSGEAALWRRVAFGT